MLLGGPPAETLNLLFSKFRNVQPLSRADVSFENTKTLGGFGKIYGDFSGVPKLIKIIYRGAISINPEFDFNPSISVIAYPKKGIILIKNKPTGVLGGNECLLEFTGYLNRFVSVEVYGYCSRTISLNFPEIAADTLEKSNDVFVNSENIIDPYRTNLYAQKVSNARADDRYSGYRKERVAPIPSYSRQEIIARSSYPGGGAFFSNFKEKK
jgi:hypothetical protein